MAQVEKQKSVNTRHHCYSEDDHKRTERLVNDPANNFMSEVDESTNGNEKSRTREKREAVGDVPTIETCIPTCLPNCEHTAG